ncbi:MAG: DUF1974 domain-containing protein, partial [Gammaproteobacteria bacterium]|nr:DUF1974 domain-containing protein [Gammaproteobacteria bacterium]
LRQPNDWLCHRVAALLIRPGEARDRLTDGIFISNDPDDITGCLEDALVKVIEAEPVERRLRHDQVTQHGLEDYAQWVARIRDSGEISDAEAGILLRAREATARVVMVDDFTPEQLAGRAKDAPPESVTGAASKAVKKKAAATAKAAQKKKRATGTTT